MVSYGNGLLELVWFAKVLKHLMPLVSKDGEQHYYEEEV